MSETYKSALAFIQFNYPTLESARCRESTDKAIEALEKQIPEKPYYLQYNINPKIGNWNHGIACICYKDEKYCSHCGQKLDWSDLSERD